jgi:hypothetical protein
MKSRVISYLVITPLCCGLYLYCYDGIVSAGRGSGNPVPVFSWSFPDRVVIGSCIGLLAARLLNRVVAWVQWKRVTPLNPSPDDRIPFP